MGRSVSNSAAKVSRAETTSAFSASWVGALVFQEMVTTRTIRRTEAILALKISHQVLPQDYQVVTVVEGVGHGGSIKAHGMGARKRGDYRGEGYAIGVPFLCYNVDVMGGGSDFRPKNYYGSYARP